MKNRNMKFKKLVISAVELSANYADERFDNELLRDFRNSLMNCLGAKDWTDAISRVNEMKRSAPKRERQTV
jgi:hypothetical protein